MEEAKINSGKKKVMVAIDESEYSYYALEWTLNNMKDTLAHSDLLIFTALSISDINYVNAFSFGAAPPDLIFSLQDRQKKAAHALLEKAKGICANHGITAEIASEAGDPKEIICEMVEKLDVHLLVLGSHSRGAVTRALLGSVSNYCVHHAKCPVVVVKKTT